MQLLAHTRELTCKCKNARWKAQASYMGQKSTHTASAAVGIRLQAVRGTAHMHPERHSKGMKEQAQQGDELQETEEQLCVPRSQTKTGPSMHTISHAFTADQREQQPGIQSCDHLLVAVCHTIESFTVGQRYF